MNSVDLQDAVGPAAICLASELPDNWLLPGDKISVRTSAGTCPFTLTRRQIVDNNVLDILQWDFKTTDPALSYPLVEVTVFNM